MINIRFDLFTNSYVFSFDEIINFINNNYNIIHKKNKFLRDGEYCGIDNIIIGTVYTNQLLLNNLYFCLDKILLLQENKNLVHPEFIVPRINNLIFI
jgi:hypothetical protein